MNNTLEQFNQNIERIRMLHSLYLSLNSQLTSVIDVTDLLRAEIVLLVSAVDYYIHEVVRIGMLETITGTRDATISFQNYSISLKAIREAVIDPDSFDWLDREVRERHGWRSFQETKKINEALKLISDKNVWDEVTPRFPGLNQDQIKTKLNLIVGRRNKIAHEADMDISNPGTRWPVDEHIVLENIDFISKLINELHTIIIIPQADRSD